MAPPRAMSSAKIEKMTVSVSSTSRSSLRRSIRSASVPATRPSGPNGAKWIARSVPTPSEELRASLPSEVPDGHGVYFEPNDAPERQEFFEGFTGTNFWTSGAIALALDEGTHEVWIWSPEFTVGEFWYGFGVEEDFSGGGWGPLFANWDIFGW